MLDFVHGDINWEFGFQCNWKQTGNQFSLSCNAAINECSHNLSARLLQQRSLLYVYFIRVAFWKLKYHRLDAAPIQRPGESNLYH